MSEQERHPPAGPPALVAGAIPPARHDGGRTFTSADYLSTDRAVEEALSDRINLYYNQPLDFFPYGKANTKPERFHRLFMHEVEDHFPDDARMRRHIETYGRLIYRWLLAYMFGKRAIQLATLAIVWILVAWRPALLKGLLPEGDVQVVGVILAMLATGGVFAAVNTLVFLQYRLGLENRSYALSREIVQYTRALQNDYSNISALPDQSETHFQSDGTAWGRRSAFLIRLLMWIAARMEYLEKYIQVSMWRVRRERYWMDWAGGALTLLVLALWIVALAFTPVPDGGAVMVRSLQVLALVLGAAVSWASFFRWRTPVDLVQQKLDPGSWIRYADLDLDDAIGEQVRRDKERLVEYRNLTRGGR